MIAPRARPVVSPIWRVVSPIRRAVSPIRRVALAGFVALILSIASFGVSALPAHDGAAVGGSVRAATPDASPASGDTRSPGQGPGFVGAPLLAIAGVLGLGLATVVVTLIYVRLTGGPTPGSGPPDR